MSDNIENRSGAVLQLLTEIDGSFCYPLSAENNVSGYIASGYYVQSKYSVQHFFDAIASCNEWETKLSVFGLMVRLLKLSYEIPDVDGHTRTEIAKKVVLLLGSEFSTEAAKNTAEEIAEMLCTMREPLSDQLPALVIKTKRVVNRYYNNPNFNISMVGEKLGVSGYYASKKFKKHMGMPLADYICRVRVEKAKRLMLDSRLSLDLVARRVGLNDARALNAVFKRVVGLSPSVYKALAEQ